MLPKLSISYLLQRSSHMGLPTRMLSVRHLSNSEELQEKQLVDKKSPYQKENRLCILCKSNIQVDYKNPRLLSQFISPLTGIVFDKHITGLCELQQTLVEREVKKSKRAMFMPSHHKNPKYNKDPELFNPMRPTRPNPY